MALPESRIGDGRAGRRASERGFTLVELLIVVTILPLVIGAISLGLVSVFSLQSRVSNRLLGSGDLQTVDATFVKDVQSASLITTDPTTPECGTNGTQLLGLVWSKAAAVSYVSVPMNNGTINHNYSLERTYCEFGNFTTPVRTTVISYDLSGSQAPPSICTPTYSSCLSAPQPLTKASSIAVVVFPIYVPMSSAPYTMVASPRGGIATLGGEPTGNSKVPPLTLLGTGCNVLSVGGDSSSSGGGGSSSSVSGGSKGSVLSINVNGGSGNGSLGIASQCPNGAVTVAGNTTLNVANVLAPDPTSTTVVCGSDVTPTCPTPYGWPVPSDPFSGALYPPKSPPTSMPGTCQLNGNTYTCSPGYYATTPQFANSADIIFTGSPTTNYEFAQPLTLPNGSTTYFDRGAYIFDGGLTGGTNNNTAVIGEAALLYAPGGSITFDNKSSVSLTPPVNWIGTNDGVIPSSGVTIWDAATCASSSSSCTSGVVTMANKSSQTSGYGGIYVPNGGVIVGNVGTIDTSFIIAGWADFLNGLTVNITSPS